MMKWLLGAAVAGTIAYFVLRPVVTAVLPPGVVAPTGTPLTATDYATIASIFASNGVAEVNSLLSAFAVYRSNFNQWVANGGVATYPQGNTFTQYAGDHH